MLRPIQTWMNCFLIDHLVSFLQGRFEIISLSGSFLLTETDGTRSRTGGLSVALAGSDGRVLGGGVGGMLMAATPIQVRTATFRSLFPCFIHWSVYMLILLLCGLNDLSGGYGQFHCSK